MVGIRIHRALGRRLDYSAVFKSDLDMHNSGLVFNLMNDFSFPCFLFQLRYMLHFHKFALVRGGG